jgi:S1-C subfamily serine protease
VIKGWDENGTAVPSTTTMGGAYDRHTGEDPFRLPDSWLKAKDKLQLNTPMNLVTTNDIIGGNSGSPLINKNGEVIGLIFDGNIHSLGGDFGYDGTKNRAVAVHSAAILESLQNIYGAQTLADELQGKTKP